MSNKRYMVATTPPVSLRKAVQAIYEERKPVKSAWSEDCLRINAAVQSLSVVKVELLKKALYGREVSNLPVEVSRLAKQIEGLFKREQEKITKEIFRIIQAHKSSTEKARVYTQIITSAQSLDLNQLTALKGGLTSGKPQYLSAYLRALVERINLLDKTKLEEINTEIQKIIEAKSLLPSRSKECLQIIASVQNLHVEQAASLMECLFVDMSTKSLSPYLQDLVKRIRSLNKNEVERQEVYKAISLRLSTNTDSAEKVDKSPKLNSSRQIRLAIKFLPLSEIKSLQKALESNSGIGLKENTLKVFQAIQHSSEHQELIESVGILLTNNRIKNVIKDTPQNKPTNKYLQAVYKFFQPLPAPAKGKAVAKKSFIEHLTSFCSAVGLAVSVTSVAPILAFSSQIKTEAINPHLTTEITQKYTGSGLSSISKSAPEIDAPLITETPSWNAVSHSSFWGGIFGLGGLASMAGNEIVKNRRYKMPVRA